MAPRSLFANLNRRFGLIIGINVLFFRRQSFVDTIVASVRKYTGTTHTDEDITFAFYKHNIAGWGYPNVTEQVVD